MKPQKIKSVLVSAWKLVWQNLYWVLYYFIKIEDAIKDSLEEKRGMGISKVEYNKGFFGQATDYYYSPLLKPRKRMPTYREFMKSLNQ